MDNDYPSLDRLASQGMRRSRHCQYPVRSIACILVKWTHPEVSGVLDNDANLLELHPELVTMPEFFKRAGYWTVSTASVSQRSPRPRERVSE